MNNYVTGGIIRELREKCRLTQAELADRLHVSDKTISKWETGKGLPDINMLEPLASSLGISVPELISGDRVINENRSANIKKSIFYVCPVCGNIIYAVGKVPVSCCGINLPALEAEEPDCEHEIEIYPVEDEHFISIPHEMSKTHYISFIAFVSMDGIQIKKLYPEGNAEARLNLRGGGKLFWYCNRHGLFSTVINRPYAYEKSSQ